MKALVCNTLGPIEGLVVEERPNPQVGVGEIAIDVKACGINFPDLLIVQGKYQFKPPPPFTPGGEVAGTVHEVGPGIASWARGDSVVAMMPFGGLAERVVVPEASVFRVPDGIDPAIAASALTTYGTSWHALVDRAQIRAGEWLLVLGAAGGVGVSAIQIGKLLGAKVIAAASGPDKLAFCRENGADEVVDYASEDLKARVMALTEGRGADVVYDPVGGAFTEQALRATAWNGRVLVIGFATGDIPKVATNLCLLKGASLVGVFWGRFVMTDPPAARAQIHTVLDHVARGALTPRVHARFPLERSVDAMRELEQRRVRGKVVVTMA